MGSVLRAEFHVQPNSQQPALSFNPALVQRAFTLAPHARWKTATTAGSSLRLKLGPENAGECHTGPASALLAQGQLRTPLTPPGPLTEQQPLCCLRNVPGSLAAQLGCAVARHDIA